MLRRGPPADPSLVFVPSGSWVADFSNGPGAADDLLFKDFTDRDAGNDEAIGSPRPWSDATFERSRQSLATISSSTGKRILIWRVPCSPMVDDGGGFLRSSPKHGNGSSVALP